MADIKVSKCLKFALSDIKTACLYCGAQPEKHLTAFCSKCLGLLCTREIVIGDIFNIMKKEGNGTQKV